MIKAVVDIGTNSTRLAVANCKDWEIELLVSELAVTRIGEGLGLERTIKAAPLARTISHVATYVEKARSLGAESIRVSATSAVRDAVNQRAVAEAVFAATAMVLDILSGEKEAALSYLGASGDFKQPNRGLAVLDIGGGSTELVYDGGLSSASVNVGAVRLAEDHTLIARTPEILQGLLGAKWQQDTALVGVGGTITSLAAMTQGLEVYRPELVHGYNLNKAVVDDWTIRLQPMSLSERQILKGLMPERADIIPYGVYILQQVMQLLGAKVVTVSEKDLLYGLLLDGKQTR